DRRRPDDQSAGTVLGVVPLPDHRPVLTRASFRHTNPGATGDGCSGIRVSRRMASFLEVQSSRQIMDMTQQGLSVLVVDDEPALREVLSLRIADWGHEV